MTNKLNNRQINNGYERLREMKPRVQDEWNITRLNITRPSHMSILIKGQGLERHRYPLTIQFDYDD
jgi:hypothetical protein